MTQTRATGAIGAGLATIAEDGTVLDTWYPSPRLTEEPGPAGTVRLTAEQAAQELGGRRRARWDRTRAAASRWSPSAR
jgi:2,3,4,5-tetrahydropyridine-2-carboxylate N-succinyltransferase